MFVPRSTSLLNRSAIVLAVAASLAACGSATSSTKGGGSGGASAKACTVKALFVGNITGPGGANGSMGLAGVEAARDYVNAAGGINGCKLVVDSKDDASDYSRSLPLVQAALAKSKYDVVISNDYGGPSLVPFLARSGQLALYATGADNLFNDPKKTPHQFDTVVPAGRIARVLTKQIMAKGAKKIAIAVDNAAYGQGVLDQVTSEVKSSGGTIVAAERMDLNTVDMTPVVQRLRSTNADAVIFNLFGPSVGYFVKAFSASGWKTPLYGSDGVMATDLASLVPLPEVAKTGLLLAGPANNTLPAVTPALSDLVTRMAGKGEIKGAITLAVQPHDALIDFAWAANSAMSTDADKVSKWLEDHGSTPVPGAAYTAVGTNYSPTSHEWLPKNSVAIVPAGKMVNGQYQGARVGGLYSVS